MVKAVLNAMARVFATIFIASLAARASATACFDDENLTALEFQQVQGALLYVWSPRMVLSAQHAASAQRQAQLQGLRFVPLHDAGVSHAEVQAARQRMLGLGLDSANALAVSQALCATSLLERDALRHFPTAFVVQASGVHRYPIIGAMPEAAWASSIAQRVRTARNEAQR
jgi:hypothetical protein